MEQEVVIRSAVKLWGGKSHSDTDLSRMMHTNGIIREMMGGIFSKKKPKTKLCYTRAATFLCGGSVANMYELYGNYR